MRVWLSRSCENVSSFSIFFFKKRKKSKSREGYILEHNKIFRSSVFHYLQKHISLSVYWLYSYCVCIEVASITVTATNKSVQTTTHYRHPVLYKYVYVGTIIHLLLPPPPQNTIKIYLYRTKPIKPHAHATSAVHVELPICMAGARRRD